MTLLTPKPGDFGLSKIGGITGRMVEFGQFLLHDSSRYTHAFVVLDDETVIEAMPGGAIITPLHKYLGNAVFSRIELTPDQRYNIVREARKLEGTPYSFLDYVALAAAHRGFEATWLREYIRDKGHMICSQLVDEAYRRGGVNLFTDGRWSQDVTPGDLSYISLEKDWIIS